MNKALGYLTFGKTIEVWNNYYKLLQNANATAVMLQKNRENPVDQTHTIFLS